jgi:hypothetical protein
LICLNAESLGGEWHGVMDRVAILSWAIVALSLAVVIAVFLATLAAD